MKIGMLEIVANPGIPEGEAWLIPRSKFQPIVKIVGLAAPEDPNVDPGCGLTVPRAWLRVR